MTEVFFTILAISVVKYGVMFGVPYFVVWKFYPQKLKSFKIQTSERQKPQITLELKYSVTTLLIQSVLFTLLYLGVQKNIFRVYSGFGSQGYLTEIIGLFAYFFIYDAYFYWSHRLLHQGWFYKYIHVVHHKSLNPTPFASYSFHPVEAVINMLYFFPILFFFPMSVELLLVIIVITDLGNVGGHIGYDFTPKEMWKSWWGSWLTTPTHHNLHHQYSRSNYGLYWRGWDELFKTLHSKTESEFYRVKNQ